MDPVVLSVIICLAIAAALVLVILGEIRKKKQGKGSCGNCCGCPMSSACRANHKDKNK